MKPVVISGLSDELFGLINGCDESNGMDGVCVCVFVGGGGG